MYTLLASLIVGALAAPMPKPVPSGGVGVRLNDTPPVYHTMTEFDYQSLLLGQYQEYIELDLFNYIAGRFSAEEFREAGLDVEDVDLISFMADQEVGHARLLGNILNYGGRSDSQQCTYRYSFETVRDAVNFCQRLTRWGESGVYGFLPHLDSRPSAQLLLQSITTEARQQLIFRQFSGAFPMPVHFETGISQAMAWSLLSRYIVSCPESNPLIEWPIFPWLSVTNEANLLQDGYDAAITHNRPSITQPGRKVELAWDTPQTGLQPDGKYNSSVGGMITEQSKPSFVAWISQLNVTYTPLEVTGDGYGITYQPGGNVFEDIYNPIVNDTMFVGITDTDLYVTPYNLSLLNDHLFAFGLFQAD